MDESRQFLATKDNHIADTKEARGLKLGAAENFALLMVRAWVRVLTAKRGSAPVHDALNIWNRGFCQVGTVTASKSLDQFMSMLARKSQHKIEIGCPKCLAPNSDEQRILECMRAYQRGDVCKGRGLLSYWLSDEDMGFAEHQLILFVAALSEKAYIFRDRLPCSVGGPARKTASDADAMSDHLEAF
ncbi:hypothetical protein [Kordiimonas sp. SCSIO 12610]|uniref:hypothetical protein n=1 Tax=Kordiimonas sp. SCSIO 12610 TaxID=2829597 RepID=UPI00210BCC99|nr:hypothetical protein [Kordiimonas sp. SCSIO 12610]UTW56548.1 hypothetical protein KFF44_06520 [Kordiimonas sp. SCSIO 12610]